MYAPFVISQAEAVVHEFGHTFGLAEQYCDEEYVATSSEYYDSKVFDKTHFTKNPEFSKEKAHCSRFDPINPLKKKLGCGGALDSACFESFEKPSSADVRGEVSGIVRVKGNFNRFGKDTNADENLDSGDRTVMADAESTQFSIDEYNHIKKFLSCEVKFDLNRLYDEPPHRGE